jgi:hypothetical protein
MCRSKYKNLNLSPLPEEGIVECRIPHLPLAAGSYIINLNAQVRAERADYVPQAASIDVLEGDFFGSGQRPKVWKSGYMLVNQDWRLVE